eukprot:GHVS01021651.1.p1 GENE.GHVS01021651.1~~GHVS01021651.1.p1  ORF type:complete len:214 (+),score=23.88 GHVS01021651.1:129-770(+)
MSNKDEKEAVAMTEVDCSEEKVLKCRRHGCHKEYRETADNNATDECFYHSGWPIFHDLSKQWSCCGVKSYDWDEFLKIQGCTKGYHTTDPPPKPPAAPPKPIAPLPTNIKSIEEFNQNQSSQSSTKTAAAAAAPKEAVPLVTKTGKHKCCHAGCHKEFDPEENPSNACRYHPGKPVFHDLKKSWSCCHVSSYDWDDFMKLPTCTEGAHSPKLV